MAKSKKKKLGTQGPQPYWLRMSVAERAKTKAYIKAGFQGYERADGVTIPSARRIYSGLDATHGYDLRHIERWPAAKLKTARERLQSLNTLTSRPFAIVIPRTAKQRKAAQRYTGQDLRYQKEMIVAVQDPKLDKIVFRENKVAVERTLKHGSKTIKQRYLFADYLLPEESLEEDEEEGEEETDETFSVPTSFLEMVAITKRMLPDMPKKYYGRDVYYTLLTTQYGPIGESFLHRRILEKLYEYHNTYGTSKGHQAFAEAVIGFQMVGTYVSAVAYENLRSEAKANRKRLKKLSFSKAMSKRARKTGRL
jgi:hypothetical protein